MLNTKAVVASLAVAGGASLVWSFDAGANSEQNLNTITEESSEFVEFFWPEMSASEEWQLDVKIEQEIAGCMKSNGFEYEPAVIPKPFGPGVDLSSEQFGPRYGYGMIHAVMFTPIADEPTSNSGLTLQLADEEFMAALYGPPNIAESDSAPLEDRGCAGQASLSVTSHIPRFDPKYEQVQDDYYDALEADADLVAAKQQHVACIEEETGLFSNVGWEGSVSLMNIEDAVVLEIAMAEGSSVLWGDEAIETAEYQGKTEIANGNTFAVTGEPQALTDENMRSLLEREVSIWSADRKCWAASGAQEIIEGHQSEAMVAARRL